MTKPSFLADYLYYASQNEAPRMYHVWGAYFCLSAAISRRVWMFIGPKPVHCNLYVIYVGQAGGAKSSALDMALAILAKLNVPVSGDKETPEGMLRFMGGDESNPNKPVKPYGDAGYEQMLISAKGIEEPVFRMNIVASEFTDFIKVDEMGWINFFNNVYDREVYKYRTKNMGTDELRGPYITLIGGLTTQTSAAMQKDQIINSGLARRTLFQFGDRDWNNPHARPKQSEAQLEAFERCIAHLKTFSSISGEFKWDEDTTGKWYDQWYKENLRLVPTRSPSVRSWYASKGTQLMKLGMLTSLAYRTDMVLEVAHLEEALAFLDELELDLYSVFGGVGKSDMGDVALKVYQYIVSQESVQPIPLDYKTILVKNWAQLPHKRGADNEMKEVLSYLVGDSKLKQGVLTIPGTDLNQFVYATPATFEAYLADSGVSSVRQSDVTAPELNRAATASIDPLTSQPSTPQFAVEPDQVSVPPPASIVAVPLPILNLKKKD